MIRVLFFFPHNPFPPRSGAHRRCIQMMEGFDSLGARVTLASSTFTAENAWDPIDEPTLHAAGVSQLRIHNSTIWDRRYVKCMRLLYNNLHRKVPIDSFHYAPLGLRHWFSRLVDTLSPDVIVINYAFWGSLVTGKMHRQTITVMDMYDLVSVYQKRFILMKRYLSRLPVSPEQVDPEFLREDFFHTHEFQVASDEYRIYDNFQYTIAITSTDANVVKANTKRTRVVTVPMTQQVYRLDNHYDGAALYTAGNNPFNIQGYLYFVLRVLPRVLEGEPDFIMHVSGSMCDAVAPVHGIKLLGFIPDLNAEYAHARFLICPILGKTGQQIKIVEAMAHGVPVVATQAAAEGSPIRHGENGFIADDANELGECVLTLWRDRALCKRMGEAARETIAHEFSQARLRQGLSEILGTLTLSEHGRLPYTE